MLCKEKICRAASCILLVVMLIPSISCTLVQKQNAERGGTLIVGEISDYESLNPMGTTDAHARDIYNLLFLSLLQEKPDFLNFDPQLAESYEFSDDRKRLTFHLRRDVFWSDGIQVTAHDVEATFKAQKDPAVAWSGRHLKEHIDSVEIVNDFTVSFFFDHAYPYQLMDANDGPILPGHAIESVPPERIKAIPIEDLPTDGPFRIVEWTKGQALTLAPYEGYFEEGKPYLEKVIFKIIPDQVTLLTQLRSGEIDCMESVPPGEVEKIKNDSKLNIFDFPTRAYIYIGWNCTRALFENRDVRRAITMAIDRRLIIDNLYYGLADECTSPFVPLIWAYNSDIDPLPFDPGKAVEILGKEGFTDSDGDGWLDRNGHRFEFDLLTNYGNQTRTDIQVMVQEMLRKVGIKVNPVTMEWTAMLDRIKAGDFDAMVNAWRIGTKADLSPIWSCEARRPGGYNRIGYCNTLVDSLNAEACRMLDFSKAKPLFFEAQSIIYDDQPYTFLYVPHALFALSPRFRDASPDAIGMYRNLQEWWVSGEK